MLAERSKSAHAVAETCEGTSDGHEGQCAPADSHMAIWAAADVAVWEDPHSNPWLRRQNSASNECQCGSNSHQFHASFTECLLPVRCDAESRKLHTQSGASRPAVHSAVIRGEAISHHAMQKRSRAGSPPPLLLSHCPCWLPIAMFWPANKLAASTRLQNDLDSGAHVL